MLCFSELLLKDFTWFLMIFSRFVPKDLFLFMPAFDYTAISIGAGFIVFGVQAQHHRTVSAFKSTDLVKWVASSGT